MDAIILDKKKENSSDCFLTKILLRDYVENLSDDYKDYEIQREIVTNAYLDNLVITVLHKRHIPPIVLIIEELKEENGKLIINSFKILDGLQRTYRLNAIWKTLKLFKKEIDIGNEILTLSKYGLSKKYSKELTEFDSTTKILQEVIYFYNTNHTTAGFNLFDAFENNYQWFEIWFGLSPEDEVNKMLVLNAGHKPVKIKHQLELIFRNLIPLLKQIGFENFSIVREKEQSSIQFSKNRQVGSFHFSQIIAALLSLKEGRPVTTNSAYIQKLQNSDFDTEKDSKYFTFSFLKDFISSLIQIDTAISTEFHDLGVKWFGREVTLVGIYGAMGMHINKEQKPLQETLRQFTSVIVQYSTNLNLDEFENERNNLDLSKVNIGSVNKNAVYNAFMEILAAEIINPVSWQKYFNTSEA